MAVEDNEAEVERDPESSIALSSNDISKKHFRKANKMEESFLNAIANVSKYMFLYFIILKCDIILTLWCLSYL